MGSAPIRGKRPSLAVWTLYEDEEHLPNVGTLESVHIGAIVDTSAERIQSAEIPNKKQRRSIAEKRRIVEETLATGASVARVARAHGVNANQLFQWRRLYRAGRLGGTPAAVAKASKLLPVHLAVHGIASAKYPERAALVLGLDSKSEEDGLLQTREIADLVLTADLVTLSACDTGVGRLQGEGGNASLQRAFLLSGAKATLSTLWTADDTFTAGLIKEFYRNLAAGMDKGSALRKAKLDLMKRFGDQAMPFYWAGFVLDGESSLPLFSRQ